MTQHANSHPHSQVNQSNQHSNGPRTAFNQQRQTRSPYGYPSRRDLLIRRKLDLEMEAQDLIARLDSLDDEWIALQQRKTALQQQVPSLKTQAALSGLLGIRQTAAERLFAFQIQRIAQEEARIELQKIQTSHQINAVNAKLSLIDSEIDLLP